MGTIVFSYPQSRGGDAMFRLKLPLVSRIEGVTYSISTICSVHPQTTRPPHGRFHMGQAGRMPGHGSGGPFGMKRLTRHEAG